MTGVFVMARIAARSGLADRKARRFTQFCGCGSRPIDHEHCRCAAPTQPAMLFSSALLSPVKYRVRIITASRDPAPRHCCANCRQSTLGAKPLNPVCPQPYRWRISAASFRQTHQKAGVRERLARGGEFGETLYNLPLI
jgi:hypothetical protein